MWLAQVFLNVFLKSLCGSLQFAWWKMLNLSPTFATFLIGFIFYTLLIISFNVLLFLSLSLDIFIIALVY